ncbi:MAG TPA: cytochrome c oxidase subunit 3 [Holophaga sp.]|nr:cytochrome c oxidase subunit 3 [Holophaga sp.]
MNTAVHADAEGTRLGMWLFLVTELVLFGGLFMAYAYQRQLHGAAFHVGGQAMDARLGLTNTAVLITSSLTMALALEAARHGARGLSRAFQGATLALGLAFLAIKAVEWSAKFHHGLRPGHPHLASLPPGEQAFFGLYFTLTGLHGLHVVAGLLVLGGILALGKDRPLVLECGGLYWHLVDIVWIFLLPLFYLAA